MYCFVEVEHHTGSPLIASVDDFYLLQGEGDICDSEFLKYIYASKSGQDKINHCRVRGSAYGAPSDVDSHPIMFSLSKKYF